MCGNGCPRAQGGCAGCCGGCRSTALSGAELALLECFGAYAFLPVVQDEDTGALLPLETGLSQEAARESLLSLSRRGLVAVDPRLPLKGFDYGPWRQYLPGSAALTPGGQALLDEIEYGG